MLRCCFHINVWNVHCTINYDLLVITIKKKKHTTKMSIKLLYIFLTIMKLKNDSK